MMLSFNALSGVKYPGYIHSLKKQGVIILLIEIQVHGSNLIARSRHGRDLMAVLCSKIAMSSGILRCRCPRRELISSLLCLLVTCCCLHPSI